MELIQDGKKFSLPDQLKIFDTVYRIDYVDKDISASTGEYSRGQVHYISGTMTLSLNDYLGKARPFSLIWRTLWHEVMHVVSDAYARKQFPSDHETLCNFLATAINSVCLDNKLHFDPDGKPNLS